MFGNVSISIPIPYRCGNALLGLLTLGLLVGCSSKQDLNPTQPYIIVTPNISTGLDAGQSMNMTVTVVADSSSKGVSWSAPAYGTLTNITPTSATYTAPASPAIPAGANAYSYIDSLTLTSIAFPSLSVYFQVPIAPGASALPCTTTATCTLPPSQKILGTTQLLTCAPNIRVNNTALYLGSFYAPLVNLNNFSGVSTNPTVVYDYGITPFTWSLASGTLPPGLSIGLISGGGYPTEIYGTPTTLGTYTFALNVTDSGYPSETSTSQVLTIPVTVAPPLTYFSGPTIPGATITAGSKSVVIPTGITGICTYLGDSISAPGIPAGATVLSLSGTNPTTLTISAPATATSTNPVQLTYPNLTQVGTSTPVVLPGGTVSSQYIEPSLLTLGGAGTITWSLTSGSLPPGLTLTSLNATNNGVGINPVGTASILGTPTQAGTFNFTLGASDAAPGSYQQSFTQNFTIVVVPTPALAITSTTLPTPQVTVAYSQILTATGGTVPYNWSISTGSLPPGLSLVASTGVISGTPTTRGSSTFTATVTDSSNPTMTASQSLTLTTGASPLTITTNGFPAGQTSLPYYAQLRIAGGAAPATWSLISGALPPGLALAGTGAISGTPTLPGTFNFTVQTIDSTTPTPQTISKPLSITINPAPMATNNTELKGAYAFLAKGFDATGKPLALLGSFTADGAGNLAGTEDLNGTAMAAAQSNQAITGTYQVYSDGRGTMTLKTASATSTFAFAVSSVVNGLANGGRMVSFDASGVQLTGTLYLQTTSAFTNAGVSGNYTFGFVGATGSGARAAVIGEVHADGAGTLSAGLEDANLAGTITASTAIGTGSAYSIASSGRGSATLATSSGTTSLVVYVVSASQLLAATSSAASGSGGLFSGQMLKQTATAFTNATLTGTAVIEQQKSSGTTGADVQVGLIGFDGTSVVNLYSADENVNGKATKTSLPAGGVGYNVASTGRVAIAGGGAALPSVIYLIDQNKGFVLDTSTGVSYGSMQPQTPQSYGAINLAGSFALGSVNPVATGLTLSSGSIDSNAGGNIVGAQDLHTGTILAGGLGYNGTYTVSSAGRVLFTPTGAFTGSLGQVFYIASPTSFVALDLDSPTPVLLDADHQ
jgi:hypothetical protein